MYFHVDYPDLNRLENQASSMITGIDKKNKSFRNIDLAASALTIPKFLNSLDRAKGINPSIMVKLPSNNSESCIFYTATGIPKKKDYILLSCLVRDCIFKEI
jgi:hypothetical protein